MMTAPSACVLLCSKAIRADHVAKRIYLRSNHLSLLTSLVNTTSQLRACFTFFIKLTLGFISFSACEIRQTLSTY